MRSDSRGSPDLSCWFTEVNNFFGSEDFVCDAFPPCESLTTDLVTSDAFSWEVSRIYGY